MDIRKLTDTLSVSPQIEVEDMAAIKAAGFNAILCNRPDKESKDQADYSDIENAARQAGLEARYVPVVAGQLEDQQIVDFGTALSELPDPVLAYCRTGTRSTMLWSFYASQSRPLNEILAVAERAGYDMAPIAPRIGRLLETKAEQTTT